MFAVALTLAALLLAGQQEVCRAQVSIHTDANTNSYSLKTPGVQQTFTRYYGGAPRNQQVEQPQPQLQQPQLQQPQLQQPQLQQPQLQQPQLQQPQLQQLQEQLQNTAQFGGYSSSGQQYPSVYSQPGFRSAGKLKGTPNSLLQQQQQQLLAQQQQQLLAATSAQRAAESGSGSASASGVGVAAGGGVVSMPSYADQMHAAFVDYQRQRAEFEQQQHQLLQKLYHYYPDVSGALAPAQIQPQSQAAAPADVGGAPVGVAPQSAAGRFAYRRPQFSSNGLQPERLASGSILPGGPAGVGVIPGGFAGSGSLRASAVATGGDFYSTQQHMGFMQQQQQDVLRDQQQSVAQQFATSQLAPTTRQSYGMAVPMSSVLGSPSYQQSPDVSHVNFSSGNLNYSF